MLSKIKIKNKQFKLLYSSFRIKRMVKKIAEKINSDYKNEEVTIIPVLNGAFIFTADLVRRLKINFTIEFVKLNSYSGTNSTGKLNDIFGMPEVTDKKVLIIEDVIDTGFTVYELQNKLKAAGASEVKVVSLFVKPDSMKNDLEVDYYGKSVGDEFIIGYGLDFDGHGRGLSSVYNEKSYNK
jgi:hypoxanthine phosphoribosyltransferase